MTLILTLGNQDQFILVRSMADRPEAQGTIGKQLSSAVLARGGGLSITPGHHSLTLEGVLPMYDTVVVKSRVHLVAKDAELRFAENGSEPIVMPKVGRDHPGPCGSGRKYKRCHGR